jgi:SAM-dependent methyltransferase
LGRRQPHPDLVRLTPDDRRYLTSAHDPDSPLPAGAELALSASNPRLQGLRQSYATFGPPASVGSTWNRDALDTNLDLRWFRGDSLITWHYRDLPRVSRLKFFVFLEYMARKTGIEAIEQLGEDGAFGCWTYSYPGYPTVSRDLLDSANEIHFLEAQLELSARTSFSVLDIGAGYGRLAYRMTKRYPNLADYCCVDAVAESTFLAEYYLRHRKCEPTARVVPLDDLETALESGSFDLAVNVHSFSEMPLDSIAWWVRRVEQLRVPRLLIVPNEADKLLSHELDGSRRDFSNLLADAGYTLITREPVFTDPAVAELVGVDDQFHLYAQEFEEGDDSA